MKTVSRRPISPPTSLIPEPTRDPLLLHPNLRFALREVEMELENGLIPIRVYETYRSPQRQAALRAKGLTDAMPWADLHQYGLAVDFALCINGEFSWSTSAAYEPFWERLREIGDFYGLEAVGEEASHLQLMGMEIGELQAGIFPAGGDASWWENLEEEIGRWTGHPPAPDLKQRLPEATPNPYEGMPRFPVTS